MRSILGSLEWGDEKKDRGNGALRRRYSALVAFRLLIAKILPRVVDLRRVQSRYLFESNGISG